MIGIIIKRDERRFNTFHGCLLLLLLHGLLLWPAADTSVRLCVSVMR
jgi:hypothetical protein